MWIGLASREGITVQYTMPGTVRHTLTVSVVCCQVVGPAAAGVWLASIAAFMQLRYQYIHCSHFDRLHSPARAWLLSTLGELFCEASISIISSLPHTLAGQAFSRASVISQARPPPPHRGMHIL